MGTPAAHASSEASRRTSHASSNASSTSSTSASHLENSVTRLLVATRLLLDGLSKWSRGQVDDTHVSNVYVRLVNHLNAARAAFGAYRISLDDLDSVPNELRACLESCLSEKASEASYERHSPEVRRIVVRLLEGIKSKQAEYKRRIVSNPSSRSPQMLPAVAASAAAGAADRPTPSRTSRLHGPVNPPTPHTGPVAAAASTGSSVPPVPPVPPAAPTSVSSATHADVANLPAYPGRFRSESEQPLPTSFSPHLTAVSHTRNTSRCTPAQSGSAQVPEHSRGSKASSAPTGPPLQSRSSPTKATADLSLPPPPPPPPAPPSPAPTVPSSETLLVTPRKPSVDPAEPSVRALKSRDMLERRASKRFSTYNMSKMGLINSLAEPVTHGPSSSVSGGSPRSSRPHVEAARLATGPKFSPVRSSRSPLAPVVETVPTPDSPAASNKRGLEDASASLSVPGTLKLEQQPPLPPGLARSLEPPAAAASQAAAVVAQTLQVYVQLGRMTKKAVMDLSADPVLSVARLRMVFVDKFAYSPGQADFPPIYIRPPGAEVEYELEDLADVSQGTILSLHVDPMDQVKEYLDSSLASVTRELRDLKTAFHQQQAQLPPAPTAATVPFDQIKAAVAELVQPKPDVTPREAVAPNLAACSNMTSVGDGPELNEVGASDELHRQVWAVKQLRKEMAVMKQTRSEAESEMTKILSGLREQNERIKKHLGTGPAVPRTLLEAGKAQVDAQSQQLLTLVEDLQDTVDELRGDVIQRKIHPKPALLAKVRKDMEAAGRGLDQLDTYLSTVKPSWKKTWEQELSLILDEQKFLHHQEGLLSDLREDHNEVNALLAQIQQVLQLRTASRGVSGARAGLRPVAYVPPPPDKEHEGLSTVMLEVQAQAVDHSRRVRALALAEQGWAAARTQMHDNPGRLAQQLAGCQAQLRQTGGVEEAERIRQARDTATRLAMLTGDGQAIGGAPISAGPVEKPKRLIWRGEPGSSEED